MDMSTIPSHVIISKEKLEVLDTLICNECKYFLNIPPIMSFRDSTTICGRCYDPTKYENVPPNEKPTQNIALENVVQLFPFACIYRDRGCQIRNLFKKYLNHEANCRYRSFVCPVKTCAWTGLMMKLKEHFEIDHKNNLSTSTITINTSAECIDYHLISNDSQEILFQCKYDARNNKYFCDGVSLLNSQNNDTCTYNMELKFETNNITVLFETQISNTFKPIDENKALQIDVQSLKSLLNTDCLKANIKVNSVGDQIYKCDFNLLTELKCPVCFNLFIPPVFLCSNGHSVCESCKNQLTTNTCPICVVSYENLVHNYTLENLIEKLIYPCKYHISGCSFIAPSTQIVEHERSCLYSIV